MEAEIHLPPPDYLSKLSFEVLVKILRYLPVQSLLRLESLSRHLQKAVGLHLQLVKSLDFTSDKWYGFMPDAIDDDALKLLLNRCNELEYIYGLHPSNLLLRKDNSKKCISIPGITNALQLCHRLVGVEISDIHLLEAILIELPNIEILGRFRNRGGCFPCNENSQLTLPSTSKLTCLHLYGILLSELPALNGLDELHLQFVKFSNPQPFQQFQSQWLLSFMMHNCIGPTNPLHYVPLLTALGNATHLRRLDLVRVPFLGGLLQHVVEDVWKKGGFSGVEKVRISTCKNCFETDIGYLLLASEYWLEELSLQPSLTKDSFFWALRLAKVSFNMFETLELGFVHPSITSGEWTNAKLVEYGLTDYSEAPGLISDLGMSLVEIVFNSVISLTIHNCPHLQNPLLWCLEQKRWEWLKSLHLDRCHSIQLDKFCQWLTDLPVIHDVRLEHMFRAPPKGCSMVGLSAGTGLGVSSALVAPIGQMDPSPNAADDQHENNINPDQAEDRDDEVHLHSEPASSDNQLSNEKACQSTTHQRGTSSHLTESSTSYVQTSRLYGSRSASDRGCSTDDLHVRVCRDEDEEQMNDEFSWQSLDQIKDSRSIKRKSSSCANTSQPVVSTAEISRSGSGDILKQHQASQQPQFKPQSKSVISSSSPSSSPSSSSSSTSSSSTSSSSSSSTTTSSPLMSSKSSSLSTVLSTSSPSTLSCSSSSLSSPSASSSLSVSSSSSLPSAALPSPSMPSSNLSQPSSSVCGSSSLTSSMQNPGIYMEYDSQLSEQSSSSPLRKRKRQIQTSESIGTNENVAPSTSKQGDTSQGSSEQTTGMQNRCPTLEENFGLTCKAYVQECTYHDHSGQMRIRAVRTHSGQSSVIIPNNGPLYSLEQEPDVQHVRQSVPRNSSLHTEQQDTEKEHVEKSLQSNSLHRPAVSEVNKRKISSRPLGSYKRKVTNEDYEDSAESENDCGDDDDNYHHLYLKDNYTNNDSIKARKCKRSYKSVLNTDEMQLRKSHLGPCKSEEIGKVPEIKASVNNNSDLVKDNLNVPKTCIPKIANASSVSSQRQFEHLPVVTSNESSYPAQQKAQVFHLGNHLASGNMDFCSSRTKHGDDDSKVPKKRKVSTRNQSTSTSDPVPEDDPVQVMVITSKTLEGLTMESCGVSHLHLIDCPQLATLSGYDLRILRNLKVKNCPSLAHIDFSQVSRLSNPAVLEPLTWLPPTCSRFVKLSTLNMKSKSALESWLFAIDHCKYQLMYAIESKTSTGSVEGSVYMANWMDITTWLNNYYISTLTYSNEEDSRGKKKTRKSSVPKNIFITKCSIGSSRFKLSTDVPWLRTLSSNNGCQIEFGKTLPEVYPSERSDIVATLARRCIQPLTHDMAEMRSMKISFMKSVLCIYIQMSDINKQKKQPNI
ncbi:F-box only protein 38-like isoform X2 [Anneissia japonica]|uniref:F-box only protein 38-like isoform X2 n=1 Tax=Anneissia japonica TaxID=1529436 RepID=UPI0014257BCE|nr:F-box only protein 38-like isoform X2 [Anneissia japonica]